MSNIIQLSISRIKLFFHTCVRNESHTITSDIKEYLATHILNIVYYFKYILPNKKKLEQTLMLRNTKKGKNCFIFANGSSIDSLDLEKIKKYQKDNFDVFCMNSYISCDMAKEIIPDYYVLSDPASFGINTSYVNSEFQTEQINRNHILNNLNIPVFIPAQFNGFNDLKDYYIFNDSQNRFSNNINPLKPYGYFQMTGYKTLAIACFMGYDTIYICGFDNSFDITVDEDNCVWAFYKNFFDSGVKVKCYDDIVGKDMNSMTWYWHMLFRNLKLFNHHNIINLNKTSLIDVFSKKHILDIYRSKI